MYTVDTNMEERNIMTKITSAELLSRLIEVAARDERDLALVRADHQYLTGEIDVMPAARNWLCEWCTASTPFVGFKLPEGWEDDCDTVLCPDCATGHKP